MRAPGHKESPEDQDKNSSKKGNGSGPDEGFGRIAGRDSQNAITLLLPTKPAIRFPRFSSFYLCSSVFICGSIGFRFHAKY
jgi:hypothetical protein